MKRFILPVLLCLSAALPCAASADAPLPQHLYQGEDHFKDNTCFGDSESQNEKLFLGEGGWNKAVRTANVHLGECDTFVAKYRLLKEKFGDVKGKLNGMSVLDVKEAYAMAELLIRDRAEALEAVSGNPRMSLQEVQKNVLDTATEHYQCIRDIIDPEEVLDYILDKTGAADMVGFNKIYLSSFIRLRYIMLCTG